MWAPELEEQFVQVVPTLSSDDDIGDTWCVGVSAQHPKKPRLDVSKAKTDTKVAFSLNLQTKKENIFLTMLLKKCFEV